MAVKAAEGVRGHAWAGGQAATACLPGLLTTAGGAPRPHLLHRGLYLASLILGPIRGK